MDYMVNQVVIKKVEAHKLLEQESAAKHKGNTVKITSLLKEQDITKTKSKLLMEDSLISQKELPKKKKKKTSPMKKKFLYISIPIDEVQQPTMQSVTIGSQNTQID
jgi:hypothetical protein